VELQILVELGQTLFEFVDQPARKALGLGNGQLAELGAGAGDGAAPERGALDMQADLPQFAGKFRSLLIGDVDEKEILRNCGAERSAAKAIGQIGSGLQLFSAEPAIQHRGANVAQALLALRMNANVVAKGVIGHLLGYPGKQREIKPRLEFGKEALGGPAFLHK